MTQRLLCLTILCCLFAAEPLSSIAGSGATNDPADKQVKEGRSQPTSQDSKKDSTQAASEPTPKTAADVAARFRGILPVLPAPVRGSDGLLNTEGQRATQNLLVTSTNVKDPVSDTFVFAGAVPVEAAESVQIPGEQFRVTLPKFYATVPILDPISNNDWRFSFGSPLFAFRVIDGGIHGLRSISPTVSATGPMLDGKVVLFESFAYRLSRSPVESVFGGTHETEYEAFDWNTHLEIKAGAAHKLSTRLALFFQDVNFATLNALVEPEATPDFLTRGGQLFFADAYTSGNGMIVDSSVSLRKLRLRVSSRGNDPMVLIEQGEILGNYFDRIRRDSSRFEWREGLRLPELRAHGRHEIRFGGGLARTAFDSTHLGNTIILTGHEEDELTAIVTFTGNARESLAVREFNGWVEDRWSPVTRLSLTAGLKHEWTTLARKNQWAPRLGFAVLPFKCGQTVVRGGVGVFYDILPLTTGTFTRSRQRVVEFFDHGTPISGPRSLDNVAVTGSPSTPYLLGWNLEIDRQLGGTLFLRLKAEERRGRDLLLINPDKASFDMSSLVLSNGGTSRHRELETTANYRPARGTSLTFSYIRSDSVGDLNTFNSVFGTFEKLFITSNRYARSRTDSPHRFLAWGDVQAPGRLVISPAFETRTGFPFAFFDADNNVAGEADFGRFPRTLSLDLGLARDFTVDWFTRQGTLRLGFRVYNLTNHFNPRDVRLDESEDETEPVVDRFLNGVRRTLRAKAVFTF